MVLVQNLKEAVLIRYLINDDFILNYRLFSLGRSTWAIHSHHHSRRVHSFALWNRSLSSSCAIGTIGDVFAGHLGTRLETPNHHMHELQAGTQ